MLIKTPAAINPKNIFINSTSVPGVNPRYFNVSLPHIKRKIDSVILDIGIPNRNNQLGTDLQSFFKLLSEKEGARIKAHIFITCLVDALFPQVGESMVAVLQRIGVDLEFPEDQTCCGQPAFNSGYHTDAKILAKRFLTIFDKGEYIVCPSGSCTSMVKIFYKELFKNDPEMHEIAERVSAMTREFSDFIVNVLNKEDVGASFSGKVTYHDSCHLLRELRVKDEPRKLINSVKGIDFVDLRNSDACCGFGGTFSIKFPEVSVSILDEKIENIINTGADAVISGDMGCLMQIGGALRRRKIPIRTMHLAELLASDQTRKSIA